MLNLILMIAYKIMIVNLLANKINLIVIGRIISQSIQNKNNKNILKSAVY